MTSRKFAFYRFSSCIFFFSLFCVSLARLQTHYVNDLCNGWLDSTLYLRYDISGYLLSDTHRSDSGECTVHLKPDIGYSVILSISEIDLGPEDQLVITDSDNFKVSLLGKKLSFPDEGKSFLSDGTMSVRLAWNNTQELWKKLTFQSVFTQVHKEPCSNDEFKCRNKLCVPKMFKCDGHNHCGDKSDQEDCDRDGRKAEYPQKIKATKTQSNVWIITIIVSGVILAIVIIVFIALVVRSSVQKKKNLKNKNSPPTVPTTIPQNSPPMVPAAIPQNPSAPPEALVQPSVFARLRQSLRRTKPSTTPNPEEPKTESYEVPSMYPQLPEVPHLEGVDNPEFKSDEN